MSEQRASISHVYNTWHQLMQLHPEWRVGQALFNAVRQLNSDMGERLRTSGADPFYVDALVGAAVGWLCEHWNG